MNGKGVFRELENVIERAIILCEGDYNHLQDLPPNMIQSRDLKKCRCA